MPLINNIIKSIVISIFAVSLTHAGEIVDDTLQSLQIDDVAGVQEGLQRGLDVNFVDQEGHSLLMLAARDGSTQSAALLVNVGAKTYLRNAFGDDALLLATFAGHEAIVDILLAKGANLSTNPSGWAPLHYAAYAGHGRLVTKFLTLGAQVNSVTDNGLTALMIASMNGHKEVVRTLLMHKADSKLRDENGLSAVDHALGKQNTDIADLLKSIRR